jgi:hypothetical protein
LKSTPIQNQLQTNKKKSPNKTSSPFSLTSSSTQILPPLAAALLSVAKRSIGDWDKLNWVNVENIRRWSNVKFSEDFNDVISLNLGKCNADMDFSYFPLSLKSGEKLISLKLHSNPKIRGELNKIIPTSSSSSDHHHHHHRNQHDAENDDDEGDVKYHNKENSLRNDDELKISLLKETLLKTKENLKVLNNENHQNSANDDVVSSKELTPSNITSNQQYTNKNTNTEDEEVEKYCALKVLWLNGTSIHGNINVFNRTPHLTHCFLDAIQNDGSIQNHHHQNEEGVEEEVEEDHIVWRNHHDNKRIITGDVTIFSNCQSLIKLSLKGCVGVYGDLRFVESLMNLEELELYDTNIYGDGKYLSNHKNLQRLSLGNSLLQIPNDINEFYQKLRSENQDNENGSFIYGNIDFLINLTKLIDLRLSTTMVHGDIVLSLKNALYNIQTTIESSSDSYKSILHTTQMSDNHHHNHVSFSSILQQNNENIESSSQSHHQEDEEEASLNNQKSSPRSCRSPLGFDGKKIVNNKKIVKGRQLKWLNLVNSLFIQATKSNLAPYVSDDCSIFGLPF